MIYVMSDIHANYEKYLKILEIIDFSETDLLYILGDVIDRGSEELKILKDMMLRPNIIPILGNHEYIASISLPWLMAEITTEAIENLNDEKICGLAEWMENGGSETISEFSKLNKEEQEDILEYLSEFRLFEKIKVEDNNFILVHAGINNFSVEKELDDYDLSELIFNQPDYDMVYFEDAYLVTGHTPTRLIRAREKGVLLEEMLPSQYQDEIFEKNNHIAIDCGLAWGGKLGCLCLDTLEKFHM